MKMKERQLRRVIREAITDHWDARDKIALSGMSDEPPANEDVFDYVMRKALSVLGAPTGGRTPDFELVDGPGGEIIIDADPDLIEMHIGALNDVFQDGSWSDEGFYTGHMA